MTTVIPIRQETELEAAYRKLNCIARVSYSSQMCAADFRLFIWIIDHCQHLIRTEAELKGIDIP
jgi:hypothetical protein